MSASRRPALTRAAAAAIAVAGVLALSACSEDPNSVAAQAKSGDRKNYVSGDGTIEQVAVADRGAPVDLKGTTLQGQPWSMAEVKDKVLVVNVWGSWCPPCIAETPDLQKAWTTIEAKKQPVAFLGINKQESPETGLAFEKANGVTYPSLAADGGVPLLAFQGKVVATPTTLVLDKQGRIAARVSGRTTTSTVIGLVDDVLAEG